MARKCNATIAGVVVVIKRKEKLRLCLKKLFNKIKINSRGPLHDDIHFCYRKWYKGNMNLQEKITSYVQNYSSFYLLPKQISLIVTKFIEKMHQH